MTDANDMMSKAVKDFLAEAEEIIDQLSLDLVGLSDCAETGDSSPDLITSYCRGSHSLKGLAGMFGFAEIADLAHNLENLLDSLRLGKVALSESVLGVLFDSMDLLGALVRGAGSGATAADSVGQAVARINSCIAAPSPAAAQSPLAALGLPEKVLNALTEYEEHRLLENVKKGRSIYSVRASFSLTSSLLRSIVSSLIKRF